MTGGAERAAQPRSFRLERDPAQGMGPSSIFPPEAFTTADLTETDFTAYANADESVTAGVWECAPCREEMTDFPVNELMTIISGSVTLTHPDGRAETFGPGDTLFVPKGSALTWEITQTLRKFYMIAS